MPKERDEKGSEQSRRAKRNRNRGRLGEFFARVMFAKCLNVPPSCLNIRAKGANGSDIWPAKSVAGRFPFAVEAKYRERLNFFDTMDQAIGNTDDGQLPLIFALRDKSVTIAAMPVQSFLAMVRILNDYVPDWVEKFPESLDYVNERFPKKSEAKANVPDDIAEDEPDEKRKT